MEFKKLFFPIGGGEELRERIHGALLVNKWFGGHMSMMACYLDPQTVYNVRMTLRGGVLFDEFLRTAKEELEAEKQRHFEIFKDECEKVQITLSQDQHIPNSAHLHNVMGLRSENVEKYSKYCDLVVAAVPPTGKITGTFEASVIKSGKSCIVIPRVMKEFKADKILLSLTGSTASARALTNSLFLLKQAKEVHCITARHYLEDNEEETVGRIKNYLDIHNIHPTFECLDTAGKIPGQVLIKHAHDGNFDLIVAGMKADNGLKEVFLGGTSKYFLKNTNIPVFM